MFDRRLLAAGLATSAVGIVLARANDLLLGKDSPYLTVVYLLGVFLGLAGLVLVASSLKKSSATMVRCPECLALNPADARVCVRCRHRLRRSGDEDP